MYKYFLHEYAATVEADSVKEAIKKALELPDDEFEDTGVEPVFDNWTLEDEIGDCWNMHDKMD